jgi:hypothetical protein
MLARLWAIGSTTVASSVVYSSGHWSEKGNFLLLDFKLKINGRDEMNVTQRIGWDPINKRVHSWVFDTEVRHRQWPFRATSCD